MIELILAIVWLTYRDGKENGEWGLFILVCAFFVFIYILGAIG